MILQISKQKQRETKRGWQRVTKMTELVLESTSTDFKLRAVSATGVRILEDSSQIPHILERKTLTLRTH